MGAGLSASSGLPTFRGSGGLWKNHDAIELATPDAFQNDPSLVWQFYSYRRHAALQAKPNKGHKALAELARKHDNFLTLTQNVDGLSARANHPSDKLLCLHGDLFTLKCTSFSCSYTQERNYDDPLTPALSTEPIPTAPAPIPQEEDEEMLSSSAATNSESFASTAFFGGPTPRFKKKYASTSGTHNHSDNRSSLGTKVIPIEQLPTCPSCRVGLLRPGVVWFGESLPFNVLKKADDFLSASPPVDLILVIGTSGTVYPAAGYTEQVKMRGGKVAVFNIEIDDKSNCDWAFEGDAAGLLPTALEPIIGQLKPPRRY